MSALTRWRPLFGLPKTWDEEFFAPFFNTTTAGTSAPWRPVVDVREEEDHFLIEAELPGVNPENVKVNVEDGVLTLSGQRATEKRDEKDGYLHLERRRGSFSRSFRVGKQVQVDQIVARYDNGVLILTLPKKAEVKPRKIEVQVQA